MRFDQAFLHHDVAQVLAGRLLLVDGERELLLRDVACLKQCRAQTGVVAHQFLRGLCPFTD